MGSRHSTAIHICSVEVHDQNEDIQTLWPLTYHMIWHKYDVHVASLVTISLCDSHVRANLYDIGYDSTPEEHVINSLKKQD